MLTKGIAMRLWGLVGFFLTGLAVSLLLTGCGGSSTPLQLAEGFLQAVEAKDLSAASQYYAPDKQPTSWKQVMGVYDYTPDDQVPDISGCQGISYTTTERQTVVTVVDFTFATDCVLSGPPPGGGGMRRITTFGVDLEYANNRWYVSGVRDHDEVEWDN